MDQTTLWAVNVGPTNTYCGDVLYGADDSPLPQPPLLVAVPLSFTFLLFLSPSCGSTLLVLGKIIQGWIGFCLEIKLTVSTTTIHVTQCVRMWTGFFLSCRTPLVPLGVCVVVSVNGTETLYTLISTAFVNVYRQYRFQIYAFVRNTARLTMLQHNKQDQLGTCPSTPFTHFPSCTDRGPLPSGINDRYY